MERNLLYRELQGGTSGSGLSDQETAYETTEPFPVSMFDQSKYALTDPELDKFRRLVYQTHVRKSLANGRKFIPNLPDAALDIVEDDKSMRRESAAALRELFKAVRAEIAQSGQKVRVGISSGYRSALHQFGLWANNFPRYYGEAVEKKVISKGDYSEDAAKKLASYIGARLAAPGFSNHQDGLAADLFSLENGKEFWPGSKGNNIEYWRKYSWFWRWLKDNAGRFGFKPYTVEPWHWDFKGQVAPTAGADANSVAMQIAASVGQGIAGGIGGIVGPILGSISGTPRPPVSASTQQVLDFIHRWPKWFLNMPNETILYLAFNNDIRDPNALTNLLFWLMHPDLEGQSLKKESPQALKSEWVSVLNNVVQPFLKKLTGASSGAGNTPAPVSSPAAPVQSAASDSSTGKVLEFIRKYPKWILNLPPEAVLNMAGSYGISDENALSNLIFWIRHPELEGQSLKRESAQALKEEWVQILKTIVQPFLQKTSGASSGAVNTPAPVSLPTAPNNVAPAADGEVPALLTALGYDVQKLGLSGALQRLQGDSGLKKPDKPIRPPSPGWVCWKYKLSFLTRSGVPAKRLSRFRLTHYYVVNEADYPAAAEKVPVLNSKGQTLANVPAAFFNDMVMEGTGKLSDGRLLNVEGKRVDVGHLSEYTRLVLPDARKRYAKNFKYMALTLEGDRVQKAMAFHLKEPGAGGFGVLRNIPLTPFKTLAADLGYYKTSDPNTGAPKAARDWCPQNKGFYP